MRLPMPLMRRAVLMLAMLAVPMTTLPAAAAQNAAESFVDENIQRLRDQPAGSAHAGKALWAVEFDLAGLAQGCSGGFDVAHISKCKVSCRARKE